MKLNQKNNKSRSWETKIAKHFKPKILEIFEANLQPMQVLHQIH